MSRASGGSSGVLRKIWARPAGFLSIAWASIALGTIKPAMRARRDHVSSERPVVSGSPAMRLRL